MCGIFGVLNGSNDTFISQADVEEAIGLLSHRGPDDGGIEELFSGKGHKGFLGHRRLSIIDLEGGKQPMVDAHAGHVLTYNGEIYNYKSLRKQLQSEGYIFKERSDTEVILKAYQRWGRQCVEHLRGMFAFAIWDSAKGELFLARDHFGKKPLFYVQQGHSLYFSSEIKALLSLPTLSFSMDYDNIKNYLIYRYIPGPDTLIREIKKLPPGATLVWKDGRFDLTPYFVPAEATAIQSNISERDAVNDFWLKLDEAVELRMQADVPFGAFLSGGIDSSAIVALMSRHNHQRVRTFSVGFKEAEYSELSYAKVIADFFSTEHNELLVSHKDLIELLPKLIRYRDAPVSEPSDIAIYMLSMEASRTVKMVLTGEGSDEILAGYPKHAYERYGQLYRKLPGLLRRDVIEPLVYKLPYRFRRAKTAIRNFGIDRYDERMPGWFGAVDKSQASKLLRLNGQNDLPHIAPSRAGGSLRDILLFDQKSWLPDNLLERGDRVTMAASIEARMPFMDIQLAAFAATLPDKYRVRNLSTKWVLRQAMQGILPQNILDRPKVGFRIPVNEWFRTSMKAQLMDNLLSADSLSNQFYDSNILNKLVNEHVRGRQNHEKLLWTLLNLEIWMREYRSRIAF
ncbi:MAG: asparagine synthase (glutamine-hydrolyzing) [Halioglobus sp.]|nr:asparagine synthase (glutamine-hydrolyzing) [Halioglobus sp.]